MQNSKIKVRRVRHLKHKMETLIIIIKLVVVIGVLIIVYNVTRNNKHSGFFLKIPGLSFDKKESPPLIHNTETAAGSNFEDCNVFVESGRQALKNEALVSMKRINVQEGGDTNSSNLYNVMIMGGYVQIDPTAKVDISNTKFELSKFVNKSGSTRINNTIISDLKDKKD